MTVDVAIRRPRHRMSAHFHFYYYWIRYFCFFSFFFFESLIDCTVERMHRKHHENANILCKYSSTTQIEIRNP